MLSLSTELRNKLERTIIQARDVAEAGAKAALGGPCLASSVDRDALKYFVTQLIRNSDLET